MSVSYVTGWSDIFPKLSLRKKVIWGKKLEKLKPVGSTAGWAGLRAKIDNEVISREGGQMVPGHDPKPPLRKAFELNHGYEMQGDRKAHVFGAFAEIGAGQEVARNFFQAGRSSTTIAKSMSAYATMVSDDIYISESGVQFDHSFKISYVSRFRLMAMLNHEHNLMVERFILKPERQPTRKLLKDERGGSFPCLFSFANTFATGDAPYGLLENHSGWMGVRIQSWPDRDFNQGNKQIGHYVDLIAHVVPLEQDRKGQYETIGGVGVNLIYAANKYLTDPSVPINVDELIESLFDHTSKWKVRMDVLEINPSRYIREQFNNFKPNNLSLALRLVQNDMSYDALISKTHSVKNGEICSNIYINKEQDWITDFKIWYTRKAKQADSSFEEWAYPEDNVQEAARFFAQRNVCLAKVHVQPNANGVVSIAVKREILDWLAGLDNTDILPVLIIPIADLPKINDQSLIIDHQAFVNACEEFFAQISPRAALLVTHTRDLAWTIESVRNSLGAERPGYPVPQLSLVLAEEDWNDFYSFDFPGDKEDAAKKIKEAKSNRPDLVQELTRNWSRLSTNLQEFLQRIERSSCFIQVFGQSTATSKTDNSSTNLYVRSLMESNKISFSVK